MSLPGKILLTVLIIIFFYASSFGQTAFYIATENQELEKVDVGVCDTTFIAYTAIALADIAITPDNRLYGINGNTICEIDTLTGALTVITFLNGIYSNALVSDNSGYLLTVDNDSLYRINRFTGTVSNLGFYGSYASAGDLTFYHDTLYLSAVGNKLVKIIMGASISSQLIDTMQADNIFGINTICMNGDETMIASGGDSYHSSLYIVNPSNASLTLLCDSIVHTLIYGATSRKEFGNGEICLTTGIDWNQNAYNLKIYPNPAHNTFTIYFSGQLTVDNGQLKIYDLMGREVYEETLRSQLSTFNFQLNAGIYFVRVETGDKAYQQKLVLE